LQQPYDIHEDWIEFFDRNSIHLKRQERYHEYILRKTKEYSQREASPIGGDSDD